MILFRSRGAACGLAVALLLAVAPIQAADVEKLLPNDTETVVTINVKQILTSPLAVKLGVVDRVKEALKNADDVQNVLDDLGFDPLRDLDSIVIASSSSTELDRGLLIAHGRFDVAKFEAKANAIAEDMKDVLKIHKVPDGQGGHVQVYEVSPPGQKEPLFVALAGKTNLVASRAKDYVEDALDKEAGRRATAFKNKDMTDLLKHVDGSQSIWTAVLASRLKKTPLVNIDEAKELIDKLQDVSGGITLTEDVRLQLSATARDAEDARELKTRLSDGLNQGLALAAVVAGQQKELEPVVDLLKSLRISLKDRTITIKATVEGDVIEDALKKDR